MLTQCMRSSRNSPDLPPILANANYVNDLKWIPLLKIFFSPFGDQNVQGRMSKIEEAVAAAGHREGFLEGIPRHDDPMFDSRRGDSVGAADSARPTVAVLQVSFCLSSRTLTGSKPVLMDVCFRQGTKMSYDDAMQFAGTMVFLSAVNGVVINHYFMGGFHNGMKVRVAVCNLIYKKVNDSPFALDCACAIQMA